MKNNTMFKWFEESNILKWFWQINRLIDDRILGHRSRAVTHVIFPIAFVALHYFLISPFIHSMFSDPLLSFIVSTLVLFIVLGLRMTWSYNKRLRERFPRMI